MVVRWKNGGGEDGIVESSEGIKGGMKKKCELKS